MKIGCWKKANVIINYSSKEMPLSLILGAKIRYHIAQPNTIIVMTIFEAAFKKEEWYLLHFLMINSCNESNQSVL